MADEGFSREDLDGLFENWMKISELQEKASKSLKDYYSVIKSVEEIQRQLRYLMELEKKFARERDALEKQRLRLEDKLRNSKGKAKKLVKEELEAVQKELALRDKELSILTKKTSELKEQSKILEESLNRNSLLSASFNSMGDGLKKIGKTLLRQKGYLLDQQKAVRQSELSMGVLSNQADAFRANIYKASLSTNAIGVDTKQLAQMQGAYSEQVGRTLVLTEKSLEAMAELSSGTMLGADGAAALAAEMENFGISVVGTKDIVEEMLNTAHKMGVNAEKVTKNLQNNMKLAQKYHFKDGIQGLARMAATAAKFKMEMNSIAGFADKMFTPEGAVEMASQLQVLGGEWSKIADPFSLMFKARNDFEGLFEDVVHATKGMAKFNKETGQMEISGLELHRLREIAAATGIEFDQLAQASKEYNKQLEVRGRMTGMFSKEDQEYLETIAQFNEDTGQFEVVLGEEIIPVDELHKYNKDQMKSMIDQQKNEEKGLKERAKQAQTFDETWKNIVNTLKATLLPALEGFSKGLTPVLQDFNEWMTESGFAEKLADFAKQAGELAGSLIKWIVKNPLEAGLMGLLGSAMIWMARGRMLGMGFMQVAGNMGGRMMPGSDGAMMPGDNGKKVGFRAGWKNAKMSGKGFGGRMMGGLKNMRFGGMGLGLLGMGLGMGLDYLRGGMEDPNSTGGKLMGVASSTLQGASIGSMFGPIGALVGGLLGAGYGAFNEFTTRDSGRFGGGDFQDFISRPGKEPFSVSNEDTLIGMKEGGPIEKAFEKSHSSVGGNVTVTFKDALKIEGKLMLESADGSAEIDLNDPVIMRDLSRVIQQELSKAIGGGKMSSNPA